MEKLIITIGRQFASGGREIGKKIAKDLDIKYYDKEILAVAAKESGLSTDFLQEYDEKNVGSFLYSLVMNPQTNIFQSNVNYSLHDMATNAQRKAIIDVAKESCVIVGRCADYILRDDPSVIKVFICAEKKDRVLHLMDREEIDESKAEKKINKMDKERKSYYDYYTDGGWGEAHNYDICINVSRTGIDATVKMIEKYIQDRKEK